MKLYYYEFCPDSMGQWSREWFATEVEADTARAAKIEEFGEDANADDEMTGEYGDVDVVQHVDVELTADGLLAFANNWGQGA